jgi:hypothetical protein
VAKGLAAAEGAAGDLVGGVRAHARRVALVYSLLTLAGIAAIWLLSGNLFESALYTMAAVSTGGFAPHDNSLAGLGGRRSHFEIQVMKPKASGHPPRQRTAMTIMETRTNSQLDPEGSPPHGEIKQFKPLLA